VTELHVGVLENGPHPFMGFKGVEVHVSWPLVVVEICMIVQNVHDDTRCKIQGQVNSLKG
jgi:hypothetical protein